MLPRHLAITLLACIACFFAFNHIVARIAFDNNAGAILAVVCRSGFGALILFALVLWLKVPLRLPVTSILWIFLLGLLIAAQSILLYMAIARIPVAVALLLMDLYPILLIILFWLFNGRAPSLQVLILIGLIILGLVFVLELPSLLIGGVSINGTWTFGLMFAFFGSLFFALGLWITDIRLTGIAGPVRSLYTIVLVFCFSTVMGLTDVIPGAMSLPVNATGWWALLALSFLYSIGFSIMFIMLPRLDMARNAPVMNVEPVASLGLGWVFLGQSLSFSQLFGGAIVLACIIMLAYSRGR